MSFTHSIVSSVRNAWKRVEFVVSPAIVCIFQVRLLRLFIFLRACISCMILWHSSLILYNILLIFLFINRRKHVALSVTLPGLPGPLHYVPVRSHKRFACIRFVGGGFRGKKNIKIINNPKITDQQNHVFNGTAHNTME